MISLGRQVELINPDGSLIQKGFSYQQYKINGTAYFGLVEIVTNELGARSKYYLNSDGKLLKSVRLIRNEDGLFSPYQVATFDYDNLGNIKTITNPMGKQYHYTYNERGNLLKTVYPDDNKEVIWYDEGGNLKKSITKGKEIVSFEYDQLSRVTKTVYSRPQGAGYLLNNEDDVIQYIYDEAVENGKGNRTV